MKKKNIYHLLASASLLTAVGTATAPLLTQEVQANDLAGFSAEKGTFIVGNSRINVRRQPSTSGEIVAAYDPGASVNYDMTGVANGYRWISYVGGSGNRNYLAIGTADGSESWGTFSGSTQKQSTIKKGSMDISHSDRVNNKELKSFSYDIEWEVDPNDDTKVLSTRYFDKSGKEVSEAEVQKNSKPMDIDGYVHVDTFGEGAMGRSVGIHYYEPVAKKETVDLSPYSDEQKLVARAWYTLGGKDLPYVVYRKPENTPLYNYGNVKSAVFPKTTYTVFEDTSRSTAELLMIDFSDNGDGTITVYKMPKHWHMNTEDIPKFTQDVIDNAETIKLANISDEDLLKVLKQEQKFTIEEGEDKKEKKAEKLTSLSVEPYLSDLSKLRRRTDPDKNEEVLLDYFVIDIDGNGTPELLVGRDGYIQAVYTLIKGKPELVTELGVLGGVASSRGYRGSLTIYKSGEIVLTEEHSLSPERTMTTYRLRQDNSGIDKTEETYDLTKDDLKLRTDDLTPFDSQTFDWQSDEVKEDKKKNEDTTQTSKTSTTPSSSTRLTSNQNSTSKTKRKFKLPSTGEMISYLGFLGVGLIALAAFLKKEQD